MCQVQSVPRACLFARGPFDVEQFLKLGIFIAIFVQRFVVGSIPRLAICSQVLNVAVEEGPRGTRRMQAYFHTLGSQRFYSVSVHARRSGSTRYFADFNLFNNVLSLLPYFLFIVVERLFSLCFG